MQCADMDQNFQELCNWVNSHFVNQRKKNLHRDFADAVQLAKILKEYYPKLVDLHNYAPRNAILKKLENWNTLNRKVLCKLDLQLSQKEIENIAKCVPGSVEKLLFKVKAKINKEMDKLMKGCSKDVSQTEPEEISNQEIEELDAKTEAVKMLTQKISNMETLLNLKDRRISELQHKLDEYLTTDKTRGGFFEIFTR